MSVVLVDLAVQVEEMAVQVVVDLVAQAGELVVQVEELVVRVAVDLVVQVGELGSLAELAVNWKTLV